MAGPDLRHGGPRPRHPGLDPGSPGGCLDTTRVSRVCPNVLKDFANLIAKTGAEVSRWLPFLRGSRTLRLGLGPKPRRIRDTPRASSVSFEGKNQGIDTLRAFSVSELV